MVRPPFHFSLGGVFVQKREQIEIKRLDIYGNFLDAHLEYGNILF